MRCTNINPSSLPPSHTHTPLSPDCEVHCKASPSFSFSASAPTSSVLYFFFYYYFFCCFYFSSFFLFYYYISCFPSSLPFSSFFLKGTTCYHTKTKCRACPAKLASLAANLASPFTNKPLFHPQYVVGCLSVPSPRCSYEASLCT